MTNKVSHVNNNDNDDDDVISYNLVSVVSLAIQDSA